MKKTTILMAFLLGLFLAMSNGASAHDHQRAAADHPMRVIAYPFHAFGQLLDYAIARPIHYLVSLPHARIIFGHSANDDDCIFDWVEYH